MLYEGLGTGSEPGHAGVGSGVEIDEVGLGTGSGVEIGELGMGSGMAWLRRECAGLLRGI